MNRLSELRNERKLKQSELAELIGSTQQTISAYERDVYTQKDSALEKKLAEFFSCSLDYLRGLSDIRDSKKLLEDSILLKDEFVKLGIINEDEDISDELLAYFRDLIKLNKPFLANFSKQNINNKENSDTNKDSNK